MSTRVSLSRLGGWVVAVAAVLSLGSPLEEVFRHLTGIRRLSIASVILILAVLCLRVGGIRLRAFLPVSLTLLYVLWVSVPFRPYDTSPGFGLGLLGLATVATMMAPRNVIAPARERFVELLAVMSSLAIFTAALLLVGFPVPTMAVERQGPGDYLLFASGASSLTTNTWQLPWGGSVSRAMGLYREPGHFAAISAAAFTLHHFRLHDWKGKALLAGGLLSFSPVFWVTVTFGYVFVRRDEYARSFLFVVFVVLFATVVVSAAPERLAERFSRQVPAALSGAIFQERLAAGELLSDLKQDFFGVRSLVGFGMDIPNPSNVWSWIYRFGWIGLLLFSISAMATLAQAGRSRLFVPVVILVGVIVLHRSWMLGQYWLWLAIVVASVQGANGPQPVQSVRPNGQEGIGLASDYAEAKPLRSTV